MACITTRTCATTAACEADAVTSAIHRRLVCNRRRAAVLWFLAKDEILAYAYEVNMLWVSVFSRHCSRRST